MEPTGPDGREGSDRTTRIGRTAGTPGAKGDAGTAVAYARVAADGSLEPGDGGKQNKNVVSASVQKADTGVYCFGGLPFGVASAMVSPDSAGDQNGAVFTSVAVQRGVTLGTCDANHQQARVTTIVDAGPTVARTDHRFQIWFEATGGPQIAPGTRRRLTVLTRPARRRAPTPGKNSTRPPRLDVGGAVACPLRASDSHGQRCGAAAPRRASVSLVESGTAE